MFTWLRSFAALAAICSVYCVEAQFGEGRSKPLFTISEVENLANDYLKLRDEESSFEEKEKPGYLEFEEMYVRSVAFEYETDRWIIMYRCKTGADGCWFLLTMTNTIEPSFEIHPGM